MMPNAYVVAAPPPLPIESTPPPPPPPLQQKTYENRQSIADNEPQTPSCSTDQNTSKQLQSLNDNDTTILTSSNESQVHHSRSKNLENSNFLHHERCNQQYRNNRIVGNNRIQPDNEQQMIDVNEVKSQEEIAFDIQFRKWEESFLEWKKNNANHPDQNQYNDFVIKMEACRKQLFARREQLRQKRLGSNMQMNSETKAFKQTTNEWITQTADNSVQSQSGTAFFTTKNDDVSKIPGLDWSEEKVPEANLSIVAHVNNILGDPEIKTLLSNIQKQQSESQPSKSHTEASSNTYIDTQEHQPIDSLRNDGQQCVRDVDKVDTSQPNTNQFEKNAKRRRRNFDHLSYNNSVLDQNRSSFTHIGNDIDLKHVHKRIRESDIFDSSLPKSDDEEYRPVQVIDYQNRTQKQPTFDDKISPVNDHFPRKIIEYDHKSKIHAWNWFCPIFQIEYNHSKTGFSLHEHPLPRPTSKGQMEQQPCVKKEPREQYQLRHPKWTQPGTIERIERYSYGSRYENSQIKNTQTSNELYYRRNSRDK